MPQIIVTEKRYACPLCGADDMSQNAYAIHAYEGGCPYRVPSTGRPGFGGADWTDGRYRVSVGQNDEEASTLGLASGEWPATIDVLIVARGMEPDLPETLLRGIIERDAAGEITSVHYSSPLGQTVLEVWND